MAQELKDKFLAGLAGLVLLLFAGAWVWIGLKLLGFDSSPEDPSLTFTDAQVTIAGFLASAVGAGTASVLGFEIQKIRNSEEEAANRPLAFAGKSGGHQLLASLRGDRSVRRRGVLRAGRVLLRLRGRSGNGQSLRFRGPRLAVRRVRRRLSRELTVSMNRSLADGPEYVD